jgi:hypothetical protein
MHNNNHTPGPWAPDHLRDRYDGRLDDLRVIGTDDDGQFTVAKVNHHLADESLANARLIAAAPCMLLALTIARAHIRRALDEIPENDGNLSGALAVIGEAINKATGGNFE